MTQTDPSMCLKRERNLAHARYQIRSSSRRRSRSRSTHRRRRSYTRSHSKSSRHSPSARHDIDYDPSPRSLRKDPRAPRDASQALENQYPTMGKSKGKHLSRSRAMLQPYRNLPPTSDVVPAIGIHDAISPYPSTCAAS